MFQFIQCYEIVIQFFLILKIKIWSFHPSDLDMRGCGDDVRWWWPLLYYLSSHIRRVLKCWKNGFCLFAYLPTQPEERAMMMYLHICM